MIAPRVKVQYDFGPNGELLSPLERLHNYELRKAIRIAVNRAAAKVKSVVRDSAASLGGKGHLARSIRIKVKVYRQMTHFTAIGPTRAYVRVARRKGRKANAAPANEARQRRIKPSRYAYPLRKGTKRSRAFDFLRAGEGFARTEFEREVHKEIAAEIKKLEARGR